MPRYIVLMLPNEDLLAPLAKVALTKEWVTRASKEN